MESNLKPENTIEYIPQPAFLVENGIVTSVNTAASRMPIKEGTPVQELLKIGMEDYANFHCGRLYLELSVGRAWVTDCGASHLFCVEDPYSNPELKALALASQHLRVPLSNAMSSIDLLKQNDSLPDNDDLKQQISSINKSIYSLLRSICNMSDADPAELCCKANMQLQNISSVFEEIFEKISAYTAESERVLKFTGLKKPLECVSDPHLLERAILNIISNAIKFSPVGSTITISVKQVENRLSLKFENTIAKELTKQYNHYFRQYRRMPGIENGLTGIGLGMNIVSGIMAAHAGTVLLDLARKNTARITLSFPLHTNTNTIVRSPIELLGGYTGGIDSYLVELTDILPNHYYE